jgi:hypothetical protein
MVRHLTTLVLGGILGSMVLVGNAEACHKNKCNRSCGTPVACAAPVPAPCVKPVAYCKPARCAQPVVTQSCAPKVKLCCKISLPKFCHKKCAPAPVACATPVYYAAAPVTYPTPQTSAQH